MANAPRKEIRSIGSERQPLVIFDDFAADADALRASAGSATFESAGQHYPGIRAPLPDHYLKEQLPVIAKMISRTFGRCRRVHTVDASFSIVTCKPDALQVRQRLPHVDAFGPERIALVHYLSPDCHDGTAFFRHRASGFETVDAARASDYAARLNAELEAPDACHDGYIAGDTALFERTSLIEARYNRALLYRSFVLHSGAISPDATLAADPAKGRLTVTAFFSIE